MIQKKIRSTLSKTIDPTEVEQKVEMSRNTRRLRPISALRSSFGPRMGRCLLSEANPVRVRHAQDRPRRRPNVPRFILSASV